MRPFIMPIFFYGGQLNRAVEVPGTTAAQQVALGEIRALLVWVLRQVGGERGCRYAWGVLRGLRGSRGGAGGAGERGGDGCLGVCTHPPTHPHMHARSWAL